MPHRPLGNRDRGRHPLEVERDHRADVEVLHQVGRVADGAADHRGSPRRTSWNRRCSWRRRPRRRCPDSPRASRGPRCLCRERGVCQLLVDAEDDPGALLREGLARGSRGGGGRRDRGERQSPAGRSAGSGRSPCSLPWDRPVRPEQIRVRRTFRPGIPAGGGHRVQAIGPAPPEAASARRMSAMRSTPKPLIRRRSLRFPVRSWLQSTKPPSATSRYWSSTPA